MVKLLRFQWWRAIIGVMLAFFTVMPYIMGGDVEKYCRSWVDALNQPQAKFHLELQHYQRHWFTSDADISITGGPLQTALIVHLHAFHGPLFFNAGHGVRWGLAFLKATLDSAALLGQQDRVQIAGPLQTSAFIPYFSDREIQTDLPPLTINDKENKLIYAFETLHGNMDGDGELQVASAKLKINDSQGINKLTITNLVLQGHTQNNPSSPELMQLNLNIHFDQVLGIPMGIGPLEFKFKISGLHSEGIATIMDTLKVVSLQNDLSLEQGEKFQKAIASIFSANTHFELTSQLATANGKATADFTGGFDAQENLDWMDAFFSKGTVTLEQSLMQALNRENNQALASTLDLFKANGQGYVMRVDVQQGKVRFNG